MDPEAGAFAGGPVAYLRLAGLLDVHGGAVRVTALSRSHLVASVRLRDGRHLVVKRARPRPGERWGSLGRELLIYRLAREHAALAAAVPRPVWSDPALQVLVMEAVEPGTPVHARAVERGGPPPVLARRLGEVVAGWHRATRVRAGSQPDGLAADGTGAFRVPEGVPTEVPWILGILTPGGWRPPVTGQLLDLGAVRRELRAHFAELARQLVPSRLVHGDVKWDNCVQDGESGVRVIDWEQAAVGDPAWDVAGILQEYVVVRRVRRDRGPDLGWAGTGDSTADFLEAYLHTARDRDPRCADPVTAGAFVERAARLAGARLVQTALEHACVSADQRLARVLLDDALRVLRDPRLLLPTGIT
ncbi:phosphotransferase family protein [Geodermatophilus sp. SYSU D00691]